MTTLDGSTGAAPDAPRQVDLDFRGPLTFMPGKSCVFTHPRSRAPGVYLWAIPQREKNDYLIHYVGETSWLGKRHREHLIHILGLNYGIFDADAAQEGQSELLWPGLWRSPKDPDAPERMLEAYHNLNRDVLQYVATIAIFFAEFSGDKRLRKHVEGRIAENLRAEHPVDAVLYPADNRTGTRLSNFGGTLFISSAEPIRGLDPQLEY